MICIIFQYKQMQSPYLISDDTPIHSFPEFISDDMESQNDFLRPPNDILSGSSNELIWNNEVSIIYLISEAGSTNDVNEFLIYNNGDVQQAPLTEVKQDKQNQKNQEARMQKELKMDEFERTRKNNSKIESNKQGFHQDQIYRKQAKKNCLQFLACQLGKFFEKDQQILSHQERAALERLKQTPTHLEFNNLFTFQKKGCLVSGIAEFFQPHRLSQTILGSKVRNYTYKLVYKKEGNLLRKKFITSQNSFRESELSLDLQSEERY